MAEIDEEEIFHSILLREHYRKLAEEVSNSPEQEALDVAMGALESMDTPTAIQALRRIKEILK